jgi:hypothetical protein
MILEVDILMLGFEGEGAFSYSFDPSEFENVGIPSSWVVRFFY